ncbi:hypothetical protein [Ottowia thiooxydans]|uniref:hypothetical protein n=1 Tax=Ottowia thiooxydans TaxID=219182 RepID=UPI0004223DF0|nr:hypothetical protein [Ottowia thiooxydans]
MRVVWWVSAAIAAALDSTRDEAILFLSRCASGSLMDAALSSMDLQHITAFPWSNGWMLLFCIFGHTAGMQSTGVRPQRWIFRLAAMAAVMPLACMASAVAVSALPLAWPAGWRVAAWCLAMVGTCAALMHLVHFFPTRFSAARRAAPHSSPVH